ncbi:DUF2510 domain-containing protein [Nocardia vinacea]|uniref:DUF2510 domain-containing protein n=1 Tax=Nocardia vinacea TaxID=96468 RepID=UPI0033FBBAA9
MRKRFQPRRGPAARPYLPHGTPAALDSGTGGRRARPAHRAVRISQPAPSLTPGWYPDPANPGVVRWFDGRQWTPHTQPRTH